MTLGGLLAVGQVAWLAYFLALHGAYFALLVTAARGLRRHLEERVLDQLPRTHAGFERPVTILVPAHNEEANIVASVRSLLQLRYPQYEVIIVNDGSRDGTLDALIREFGLVRFPEAYRIRLPTKRVRAVYRSPRYPNLRVIDKENGGKADALNAGINAARYPLFCTLDADSILERDSLERIVQPFLEDPGVVACGGTVRVANGCRVRGGFLERPGTPRNLLALVQVVEYLRAFLFGRLGWSAANGVLVISGAFGAFHKETVVAAGGYRTDTLGEDMELVVRLHDRLGRRGLPHRIVEVPDAVCWTEVPEDLRVLGRQRVRWQRGLAESLVSHRGLLLAPGSRVVGWIAVPFAIVFDWLGPIFELTGYVLTALAFALGLLSGAALLVMLAVSLGCGLVLSLATILVDDLAFRTYPRPQDLGWLVLAAVVENCGYRQLTAVWRLRGLLAWALRCREQWGVMPRRAVLRSAD